MKIRKLVSWLFASLWAVSCSDGGKIVSHLNKNGEGEYHLVTTGYTVNGTTSLGYYAQDESTFCLSYRDYDNTYTLEVVAVFTIGDSDGVAVAHFGRTVEPGVSYATQYIADYDVHTRNHSFSSISLYETELNQLSASTERYANNDIERAVKRTVNNASKYLKKRSLPYIY